MESPLPSKCATTVGRESDRESAFNGIGVDGEGYHQ